MSIRVFQPVGQVRLTNVAILKLKSHGLRFEVACYRNKILNYRAGIESDLDEVLQIRQVFTNVSKGQVAKTDELTKAFETTDLDACCKFILEKGELQVSKEERQVTLEAIFRDICTVVTTRCINPRSGLPVTLSTVANSLKECGFSTKLEENTKKQALRAIDMLCTTLPDHIRRAPMRLRVSANVSQRLMILQKLHSIHVLIEEEHPNNLPVFKPVAASTVPPIDLVSTSLASLKLAVNDSPNRNATDGSSASNRSNRSPAQRPSSLKGRSGNRRQRKQDRKIENANAHLSLEQNGNSSGLHSSDSPPLPDVQNKRNNISDLINQAKNIYQYMGLSEDSDDDDDTHGDIESRTRWKLGMTESGDSGGPSHSEHSETESEMSGAYESDVNRAEVVGQSEKVDQTEEDVGDSTHPTGLTPCPSTEIKVGNGSHEDESPNFSNQEINGTATDIPSHTSQIEITPQLLSGSHPPLSPYSVTCLCDPNVYRAIEEMVSKHLTPSGRVLVVAANVKLSAHPTKGQEAESPQRYLDKLQADKLEPVVQSPKGAETRSEEARHPGEEIKGGSKCSTCGIWTIDVPAFRKHCKTAWHTFNLKRSVRELAPVAEAEFNDLAADITNGFLAVE
eukprot:GHVN01050951.1.p1 GENE.GHVN01050951.1~~GHVN01050951.1.p1  ORF type:complete len:622 (+),score=117.15 GHVN01050951.1:235-2100(+)